MSTMVDPTPASTGEAAPSAPASAEERLLKIIAPQPAPKPRAEDGKFTRPDGTYESRQPAPEQPAAQPAQGEQPAAEAQPAVEGEQPAPEEFSWDAIKDMKLRVPMKQGEKEWEDEVSLETLRAERLMQSDYTRKMQDLARQRGEAETQMRTHIEGQRTQYLAALQGLQQVIVTRMAPDIANVNWSELANTNPAEYVRLQNRQREVAAALNAVQEEQQKVIGQQSKERQEALDKAITDARTKVATAIPDWSDDLYQGLLKRSVETYGFTPQEAGQWFDPRIMRVLHDAHQFQLAKETKPVAAPVEKRVLATPAALKPGAKTPQLPKAQADFQAARTQLKRTGHVDDATNAFRALLAGQNRRTQ